jgi:deazaflavin-dependent oxidoreductase (nitroreductase family)
MSLAETLLRTQWLVRAPIGLYRAGFGWMLGTRLVMIEHLGRVSHEPRYVVVEVVARSRNRIVVASGFGRSAQWYRNLEANGVAYLSTGTARRVPARPRLLDDAGSQAVLDDYRREHPLAWRALGPVLTNLSDDAVTPMVEFGPPDGWR